MRDHRTGATALLALWNDVDPALDTAYNEWHANEHVPERLTVPGIVWAYRWAAVQPCEMPRYLTLSGLRDANVVESAPYRQMLREPTPASRAMRPALRNLSRWICRLDACAGLEQASRLAVRTFESLGDTVGELIAERLPEAADLPWLVAGQTRPVEGRVLVGRIDRGRREPEPGFAQYEPLPVGH